MSQEQKDIAPGTQTNPDSAPLHPGYVTETDGTAQAGETPNSAPLHPGYVTIPCTNSILPLPESAVANSCLVATPSP